MQAEAIKQGYRAHVDRLSTGWRFGGRYRTGAEDPAYDDSGFEPVTVPHCVTALDWHDWDPASWQDRWIYRRRLDRPAFRPGDRVFLEFAGSMTSTTVCLNGECLGEHRGGYLPFGFEVTDVIRDRDNVLAVIVDGRWAPVPPDGDPAGAASVDYLQPAGLYREVTLRVVPAVHIADVFALPGEVLSGSPRLDVQVTVDGPVPEDTAVQVVLSRDGGPLAAATVPVPAAATSAEVTASLTGLRGIELWDLDTPNLYDVVCTLIVEGRAGHEFGRRVGFRDARFEVDGFFLNGRHHTIFGLNRHQIYPYVGMAMPARVQRKDAELLKHEFNCTMVRCSHYPQSEHFLDACDELGLLVWQEPPGWQYVSDDPAWRDLALRDMRSMVLRDRNRPSVVLWAARLNETKNYPDFYAAARETINAVDGSRPTTGAMIFHDTEGWDQDVFAFDDYHSQDGDAVLRPPLPDVPYLVSESVGALSGPPLYRWSDDARTLARQAICHAQVHDQAVADPRYAGLLGWCAFDYDSMNGGERVHRNMKTPGIADTFRVPKPGAAFYRSQVDPHVRAVIIPAFYWDFGPQSPPGGPGAGSVIGSNCDRLEIYVDDVLHCTSRPDSASFPHLRYPLHVVDLDVAGSQLRIEGFVGDDHMVTRRMSADTSRDRLSLEADDGHIDSDGVDATRLVFRAVDEFGNQRPFVTAEVSLDMSGPGEIVGRNPFPWKDTPGVGAVWIRSMTGARGKIRITARHPDLGTADCSVLTR